MHKRDTMKTLHIITRLDCGGSAENTLLTAIGMSRKGHITDIVCGTSDNPASVNEKIAEESGVTVTRLDCLVRNPSLVKDCFALFTLIRLIRKGRYDIVHTHTSKAGILGRAAAKLAGAPCIVHTPHGHIFYGYFSALITAVFVHLERLASMFTNAQITLTQAEKRDYLLHNIGTPDRIFPVYSGIDLDPFKHPAHPRGETRRSLGLDESKFVAGTVARLVPVKNHDLIVSAALRMKNEFRDIRFVFVGDGELRGDLEARVKENGMSDRFIFTGWRNDISDLLAAFDIFIMCSKNEGMGRAFVEAQAAGVPVIGTRVGGVAEVLDEGRTGYLVDPDNAHELAEKIEILYRRKSHRNALSDACRKWVDPKFSAALMVDEIESVYRRARGESAI
jgi:glycosyltransferase involved in cell wall biosynthesis